MPANDHIIVLSGTYVSPHLSSHCTATLVLVWIQAEAGKSGGTTQFGLDQPGGRRFGGGGGL